jgi:hypothetical protein
MSGNVRNLFPVFMIDENGILIKGASCLIDQNNSVHTPFGGDNLILPEEDYVFFAANEGASGCIVADPLGPRKYRFDTSVVGSERLIAEVEQIVVPSSVTTDEDAKETPIITDDKSLPAEESRASAGTTNANPTAVVADGGKVNVASFHMDGIGDITIDKPVDLAYNGRQYRVYTLGTVNGVIWKNNFHYNDLHDDAYAYVRQRHGPDILDRRYRDRYESRDALLSCGFSFGT